MSNFDRIRLLVVADPDMASSMLITEKFIPHDVIFYSTIKL